MPLKFLHRFVIVLTSLAFMAGATLQIVPPVMASAVAQATQALVPIHDCSDMVGGKAAAPIPIEMPCPGMTSECMKAMGCVGLFALPLHITQIESPIIYDFVIVPILYEIPLGRGVEPPLFPPRPA